MGETGKNEGGLDKYNASNMCYSVGDVKTAFATEEGIKSMKAMVADTDPDAVTAVADAWSEVQKKLVSGEGSVKSLFDKAVDHVLQHWEGESADEFAKKAKKVSKQLTDCGTYAQYTSIAMHSAGRKLAEIKPQVMAIEVPGDFSSAMNSLGDGFSRNDENWRGEISGNKGAQKALDQHDDDLSAGKEEQLKAAAKMEELASTYSAQTKSMGSWEKRRHDGEHDGNYPGEPGGIAPVPVPVTPGGANVGSSAVPVGATGTGSASKASAAASPRGFRNAPGAGTKIDGISGGTATEIGRGGSGTPSATGGAGVGANTGGPNGGVAGGPGMVGHASGNRGITGAGAAGARGGSPKAGIGAGAGAAGARGMGGMGGGAGAGAGGKGAAAGGRGPLARQRGGILDTPGASKGAEKQGGSSLHSSRGGAEAGQRGRGTPGMLGGAGANNGRGREKEGREHQRPDYLVEDEETWVPKRRDVAPPTIG